MVSIQRTIRSIRRVGLKEWFRQLQYIGDAKSGRFVGRDQYVSPLRIRACLSERTIHRFGNRYFENLNAEEEVPGACISFCKTCPCSHFLQVVTDGWTSHKYVFPTIHPNN